MRRPTSLFGMITTPDANTVSACIEKFTGERYGCAFSDLNSFQRFQVMSALEDTGMDLRNWKRVRAY